MKKILLIVALLFPTAYAQELNRGSFDQFMHKAVGGGLHTVGFGSNGTPVPSERISSLTPGSGWVNAGSAMSVATHPDGVEVRGRAHIPIASNAKLPVSVSGVVSKASITASLMRCMGNFLCATAFTVGSSAVGQWLSNSDLLLNPAPSGPGDLVAVSTPNLCLSDCWTYKFSFSGQTFPSFDAGCAWHTANLGWPHLGSDEALNRCYYGPGQYGGPSKYARRAPDTVQYQSFNSDHARRLSEQGYPGEVFVRLLDANDQAGISPGVQVGKVAATPESPVFTPQGQKTVSTEKIINADGSTSIKETTKQTSYQTTANEDGSIKVKPITTTTVKIDGQEVPELTKVEEGKSNEQQDIETCGLPNTPACKINEDGTPEAQQDTHKKDVDDALADLTRLSANPATFWPTLPEIRWDFALPTGCAAIALPAFQPWLQQIDVCQFQPIFHDIMSAVWVLGGLFGAISIFWRSTFAKAA